MARTGTNDPVLIDTAERRAFVMNLRKSGATYRQIAAAASERFGLENLPKHWDERSVWKDVRRELDKLASEIGDAAGDVRLMNYERLLRLLLAVWERALAGDMQAVDRAARIVAQICQLMGANAPAGVDLTTGGQPVTFRVVREEPADADA